MSDELPPLPSDIRDLVAADRRADTIDDERRRRIARNVGAAILAGGAVGVAVGMTAKGGLLATLSAFFSRKAAVAATAFALGGAAGAGGYAASARLSKAPEPVCPSAFATGTAPAPKQVAPMTPTEPAPAPVATASASATETTTAAPVAPSVSNAQNGASELAAEKDLIDTARSALLRGNAANALAACATHEKRFPNGKLVEEREYVAIASLTRLGRDAEARARFASFKKRFPQSFYAVTLEQQLEPPP
ncbi:MAG: hypothetical protein HYV09_07630 [Deltaproteobacteria bacterium]|nr:hypothetical protein [Deltaproteobacteria bacterium]